MQMKCLHINIMHFFLINLEKVCKQISWIPEALEQISGRIQQYRRIQRKVLV